MAILPHILTVVHSVLKNLRGRHIPHPRSWRRWDSSCWRNYSERENRLEKVINNSFKKFIQKSDIFIFFIENSKNKCWFFYSKIIFEKKINLKLFFYYYFWESLWIFMSKLLLSDGWILVGIFESPFGVPKTLLFKNLYLAVGHQKINVDFFLIFKIIFEKILNLKLLVLLLFLESLKILCRITYFLLDVYLYEFLRDPLEFPKR